ncbi:putative Gibberellin 3-beta-dioxygenase [Hibiscus syriacus]|uniref:Gibberellin 3-beta-dioxygenase n=1 Tax=Hibiscus syriacus TaxID=106335 RepID=A0A6A2YAS5_HIBSY|nr:putative Gibberellin 3-beta-dioxygenase [Hibiscus syriacus]
MPFNHTFKLWDGDSKKKTVRKVASFNTSFLINIFRVNNSVPGEGVAFLVASNTALPPGSSGQYLGLTNSSTDGLSSNNLEAIELDTFKQDFDPDDNHIGLNINGVRSKKTVSLSDFGIQIAPNGTKFYVVWIEYNGLNKSIQVYIAEQGSTGSHVQLNCVLRWNLTVEILPGGNRGSDLFKIWIAVGVTVFVLVLLGGLTYYWYKKRKARSDPNILGALKSLPGTPREFKFRDLKNATNKFDDKHELGQGGFGVVYKGSLPKENLEIAVKKFSGDIKGKDDFVA